MSSLQGSKVLSLRCQPVFLRFLWIPRYTREGLIIIALSQRQGRLGKPQEEMRHALCYLLFFLYHFPLTSVGWGYLISVGYFVEKRWI